MTRTIYSDCERPEQFLKQNAFLTYSCRFLRSYNRTQIIKNIGIYKQEKLENILLPILW
jgi:hypothetical protein